MSTAARRTVTIVSAGDVEGENIIPADNNATAPGVIQNVDLEAPGYVGDVWTETEVEVTVPTGATAVTIQKPGDNAMRIRLKGDSGGDTVGMLLHPTDPDSISLASGVASFWLANAARMTEDETPVDVTVKLFWS